MKLITMVAVLVLATSVSAQDTQSMPGMNMPAKPKQKADHQQSAPAKEAKQPAPHQDQSMPGMKMDDHKGSSMPGMKMDGQQQEKPPAGTDMQNMQGMRMDSPATQAPARFRHARYL